MSLISRNHKEAEDGVHHHHQPQLTEHGFRKNKTRNDDTQEKDRHEAAASYIE